MSLNAAFGRKEQSHPRSITTHQKSSFTVYDGLLENQTSHMASTVVGDLPSLPQVLSDLSKNKDVSMHST